MIVTTNKMYTFIFLNTIYSPIYIFDRINNGSGANVNMEIFWELTGLNDKKKINFKIWFPLHQIEYYYY